MAKSGMLCRHTRELAKAAACGHEDEKKLRRLAQTPVSNLCDLAGVLPQDDILEFDCGVARVGLELGRVVHLDVCVEVS